MRATANNQTLFEVTSAMVHSPDNLFTNRTGSVTIKKRIMGITIIRCSSDASNHESDLLELFYFRIRNLTV